MTTIHEVLNAVIIGDMDDDLERIQSTVRDRIKQSRRQRGELVKAQLKIGDVATLVNISPKYLQGLKVTIVSLENERVTVRITDEDRFAARKYTGPVTVQASCLRLGD